MLFLLGACIGRRGLFRPSASHVPLLRKVLIWGLAVGLPANAILAATAGVDLRPPTPGRWVLVVIRTVGVPALSLAWAAGIMLLLHRPTWRSILKPFAAVGRLSFTNYLLQSVAGVAIGYGVGLGTWGRIGMAWSIVLIFALFAVQVLFSLAWLRWFRFGPVEWVWRCLAYGRVLPIRAERSASAALESA